MRPKARWAVIIYHTRTCRTGNGDIYGGAHGHVWLLYIYIQYISDLD
jgi:hypothetical protein